MSKRYAGRREDLVEAAVDLFAANGYAGTSIRDIARSNPWKNVARSPEIEAGSALKSRYCASRYSAFQPFTDGEIALGA